MATIIRMPEVAANATHATLVSWSKQEGDKVSRGQSIADVETEKAVIELNVDAEGTIARLLVGNGAEVPVGAPIAVLIAPGETVADADRLLGAEGGAVQPVPASTPLPTASPTATATATAVAVDAATQRAGQRIFSSPVARLLARQHGLTIADIVGSGPNGRVVKHDVMQRVQAAGGDHLREFLQRIHLFDSGFSEGNHRAPPFA